MPRKAPNSYFCRAAQYENQIHINPSNWQSKTTEDRIQKKIHSASSVRPPTEGKAMILTQFNRNFMASVCSARCQKSSHPYYCDIK